MLDVSVHCDLLFSIASKGLHDNFLLFVDVIRAIVTL